MQSTNLDLQVIKKASSFGDRRVDGNTAAVVVPATLSMKCISFLFQSNVLYPVRVGITMMVVPQKQTPSPIK